MLELKSDWEKAKETDIPEYKQLIQDIEDTEHLLEVIKNYGS